MPTTTANVWERSAGSPTTGRCPTTSARRSRVVIAQGAISAQQAMELLTLVQYP